MKPSDGKQPSAANNNLRIIGILLALHGFIGSGIIPAFQYQRHPERYQFAVLLLIPESADINNLHRWLWPLNLNGRPLVDNRYCCNPNRFHYRNYVSARPYKICRDFVQHAEDTLLQELPNLWDAFVNHYSSNPCCIILYSWMMPCPDCTELICQMFQNTSTPVIVAYTIDWKRFSLAENEESRRKLRAAGIEVEKVKYAYRLDTYRNEQLVNSLEEAMRRLQLQDAPEEYNVGNLEECNVINTVADSEEYNCVSSAEEGECETGEEQSQQLPEEYFTEQPSDGNGLPPVEQDEQFPEVPVRRKPPQASSQSEQEDNNSPTWSDFKTFLSTNDDDQCEDDGNDIIETEEDEPPDRYEL